MAQQPDPSVLRALEKWPNVPACYGWLRLDRRGRWLIQDAVITHQRSIEFLSRNYLCDECGQWFVQNGPQRAYCTLDYTPWVYTFDSQNGIATHTNALVEKLSAVYIDEIGNLLLDCDCGIGLLVDRDLARFIEVLDHQARSDATDKPMSEQLVDLTVASHQTLTANWFGDLIVVATVRAVDVPSKFGFTSTPRDLDS